jgi:hypothetical protein
VIESLCSAPPREYQRPRHPRRPNHTVAWGRERAAALKLRQQHTASLKIQQVRRGQLGRRRSHTRRELREHELAERQRAAAEAAERQVSARPSSAPAPPRRPTPRTKARPGSYTALSPTVDKRLPLRRVGSREPQWNRLGAESALADALGHFLVLSPG